MPDLTECASFVIIIRCIWERGQAQKDALTELNRRGLWLNADQKRQAGISQEKA